MNTLDTAMYDWNKINWRKLEQSVFKLQKRIYQATCREDVKTVQQKMGVSTWVLLSHQLTGSMVLPPFY